MSVPLTHVLCVEDDLDTCELLEYTSPDIVFTFANSFAAALDAIRYGAFDLYVLDNWLPDGSGTELCREIRKSDPNTPVIFLSAAAYTRDHDEAMAAGANAYLNKPNGVLQLEIILRRLVREAEANSLRAKAAEIVAIREEVDAYLKAVDVSRSNNTERTKRAFDHLLRARAYSSFIASGGVGSHFERLWPDAVDELVKGRSDRSRWR